MSVTPEPQQTIALVVPDVLGLLSFALGLWLLAYLPLAMRRVYGGSILATGVRWFVLMALHVIGMVLAIVSAVGFGILH